MRHIPIERGQVAVPDPGLQRRYRHTVPEMESRPGPTKFMECPLFAATRILTRLLGAWNDSQKPVIAARRAIPAIQSGPKRDSFQFVKKMPFRSAIAIRENELAVAIFRAWAILRRISDIRHIP